MEKKEEEMKQAAQGFMPIKTHLLCSTHGLRCLISPKSGAACRDSRNPDLHSFIFSIVMEPEQLSVFFFYYQPTLEG